MKRQNHRRHGTLRARAPERWPKKDMNRKPYTISIASVLTTLTTILSLADPAPSARESSLPGDWVEIGSHPLAPIGLNISTSNTFTLTERWFCDRIGENCGGSWVVTNVLTGAWSPVDDLTISLSITNRPHRSFSVMRSNDTLFLVAPGGSTNVLHRPQATGVVNLKEPGGQPALAE